MMSSTVDLGMVITLQDRVDQMMATRNLALDPVELDQ